MCVCVRLLHLPGISKDEFCLLAAVKFCVCVYVKRGGGGWGGTCLHLFEDAFEEAFEEPY